jgi:hypothetical protein
LGAVHFGQRGIRRGNARLPVAAAVLENPAELQGAGDGWPAATRLGSPRRIARAKTLGGMRAKPPVVCEVRLVSRPAGTAGPKREPQTRQD